MNTTRRTPITPGRLILALVCAGCASTDPAAELDRAHGLVAERSEGRETTSADPREIALPAVDAIVVSHRRDVAAAFARIGIARADFVQATLLPNPTLSLGLLVTDGIGPDKRQASFTQPIAELFVRGQRIRATEALLDAAICEAADCTVDAIAVARASWRRCAALDAAARALAESEAVASRAVEVAEARFRHGQVSAVALALARANAARVASEGIVATNATAAARIALAEALGLDVAAADGLVLVGVDEAPVPEGTLTAAVELARRWRLENRIADAKLAALRADAEREEGRLLGDVRLGVVYERVVDRLLGPVLTLVLPIFDQGQARIAGARARVKAAEESHAAQGQAIDLAALAAAEHVRGAARLVTHLRNELVPATRSVVERAEAAFLSGSHEIDDLLEAQRAEHLARVDLARAELEYAAAVSELERAIGRWPLPEITR